MSAQNVTPRAIVQAIVDGLTGRVHYQSAQSVTWIGANNWGVYVSDVGDRYTIELSRPDSSNWFVQGYVLKSENPARAVAIARRVIGLPTD